MPDALILVVDDDRHMRSLMALALRQAGYAVRTAADGIEALGQLGGHTIDLIVCDIRMPGLDGRSLGQQLLERPDHPHMIFVSAAEDKPATLPGAFLQKPFRFEALVTLVGEVLKRRR
jgi:CheY-like chemotaxis protein